MNGSYYAKECNEGSTAAARWRRRRRRSEQRRGGAVRTKVRRLQTLIPGGKGLKPDRLFLLTADYILHLRLQVNFLQALSKVYIHKPWVPISSLSNLYRPLLYFLIVKEFSPPWFYGATHVVIYYYMLNYLCIGWTKSSIKYQLITADIVSYIVIVWSINIARSRYIIVFLYSFSYTFDKVLNL